MSIQWTEEQQKVIELRNRNILVSAAAGSGKTAVLVERIIRILTDSENPVDVDRLLIVTFTEAAAAEMKERIREAIEKELEKRPEDVHLQRQATLIHSAHITTIHSFCISVIREHFHVIDIDPGFRVAEEGELKLLKQDVLGELLEQCYAEGDPRFLEFVEKLGSGRNDRRLDGLILQLYEYSRSYPQPEKWLRQCAQMYRPSWNASEEGDVQSVSEQGDSQRKASQLPEDDSREPLYFKKAAEQVKQYLADIQELLCQGIRLCEEPDGSYMYAEMLEADQKMLEQLLEADSFAKLYERISNLKWKRLSAKKDPYVDQEKRERIKSLRDQVKKLIRDLAGTFFYEEPEELLADMASSYDTMKVFTELVVRFGKVFAEQKQSKNIIDFNDMEQFALRILTEEQEGELVPSLAAREYQEQFVEVMIDEYQDSNLIQEAILTSVSTVSRGKNNIFMVGDVKQSIYRFRLSRPELFMEKYDTYDTQDSVRQRIDLHRNFRSRPEVLDSVNDIFRRIMQKGLGGILYDEQAALYPGAAFEPILREDGSSVYETELLLLDTSDSERPEEESVAEYAEGTGRELEARMVAKRIHELVRNGLVKDKKTGELRKARYQDMVVLIRSIKGWAEVFSAVLMEEGIPAYAGSREGYFGAYEVSVLLDYLRLLDNQRQDVPLAAVLASPFTGLDAGQMAEIRTAYPEGTFYGAVERYVNAGREEAAEEKSGQEQAGSEQGSAHAQRAGDDIRARKLWVRLDAFYRRLEYFRNMVPYTAIHELLWKIIEETGYGLYIAAMPGGEQRTANVEMLVEKAAAFEGTSYKGLFHFVRYIEQLRKYDVDYGEANIADEQSDTVRIMSIHKSKGLEFPIVFVAGMGKPFNTQDTKGAMIIHPEWGVGIDAVDLKRRTKIPTFLKKIIQRDVMLENLGEELRVLYVAMTRAKEKLILTGQLPEAEKVLEETAQQGEGWQEGALPFFRLAGARRYLDWVLPAVCGREAPLRIYVRSSWDAALLEAAEEKGEMLAREVLEHWDTQRVYAPELKVHLEKQTGFIYPYENDRNLKMKFTVSELKKRAYLSEEGGEMAYEEPDVIPLLPQFLQENEELAGASRGSAYHKLLELLDFTREYGEEELKNAIRRLREEKKLSEEMAACIRTKDILGFLHCRSGERMRRAACQSRLYKEQPFVLGVDAKEIYSGETSEEVILIQGIIDVYFEEGGELVVLDYKTDQVKRAADLKEKYHAQLEYYAEALEQLLGKPVKEKIIYSFTLKEEIEV